MSIIPNTRKVFKFALEINGLNQMLIQRVQAPSVELGQVEHGSDAASGNTKTPGKLKIGDCVLEKVKPSDGADTWAWEMLNKARQGLRINYTFFALLHELDETGTNPISSWDLGEVWVKKIDTKQYDRMAEDNIIETVTLSVDRYELRGLAI